jgi:beta-glucanase (GH16 family)
MRVVTSNAFQPNDMFGAPYVLFSCWISYAIAGPSGRAVWGVSLDRLDVRL